MIREIVQVGHPALRRPAAEVDPARVGDLVEDLIDTMRAADGAGLAAPQIGVAARVAVVEVRPGSTRYPYKPPVGLTVLINPVLEPVGDAVEMINEGCLSVPELRAEVPRAMTVRVRHLDRDGRAVEDVRRGLTAGTFQHEVDHLDGVLFLDRVQDPRTFTTWANFDADAYGARARAITERYGS